MKRSTIIAAVTTVAVIGGAAAASASLSGSDASPAAQELQASAGGEQTADGEGTAHDSRTQGGGQPAPDGDAASDDRTGVAEQVVATAEAAVPGHVVDLELDLDDNRWEVDLVGDDGREHELDVSLDGTEVLSRETEDDDARADHALLEKADVSAADAARIAEEHLGGHAEEVDLDREDGVWEIDLVDADGVAWELTVDVNSGKVADVERDD